MSESAPTPAPMQIRVAALDRTTQQTLRAQGMDPNAHCRLILPPMGITALPQTDPATGAFLGLTIMVPQGVIPLVDPLLKADGNREVRMTPIKALDVVLVVPRHMMPGNVKESLDKLQDEDLNYKAVWLGLVGEIQRLMREGADRVQSGLEDQGDGARRIIELDQILEKYGIDPVTGQNHAMPAQVVDLAPEGGQGDSGGPLVDDAEIPEA